MGFIKDLKLIPDLKVEFDKSLKKHTTFGVGGNAKFFITANSLYTFSQAIELLKAYKKKFKIIGGGSNVLVSDKGFNGAIVKLKLFDVYFSGGLVRAMAGASLKELSDFCLANSLSGVESLVGIPATVGGAVTMNASAFGQSISDFISFVEVLEDGKIKKIDKKDCQFSYRNSRFKGKNLPIVAVNFDFKKDDRLAIENRIKYGLEKRKQTFPQGKSCGSVFKNPDGDFAGRLIEQCGLKGYRVGGAIVSDKHANFIINDKNASATDVQTIIKTIKSLVKTQTGIILQEEVERLGNFT
jgi:UDP-N-acetylmuramate dehydrogenase